MAPAMAPFETLASLVVFGIKIGVLHAGGPMGSRFDVLDCWLFAQSESFVVSVNH